MEKGRLKVIGWTAGTMSAFLAGAVAWGQLDLPRPAWHSEVAALAIQVASNTQIILGNKWLRLTAEITELEDKITSNPPNKSKLIAELATKQLQLRAVNSELK